jgi:hypothetical protein
MVNKSAARAFAQVQLAPGCNHPNKKTLPKQGF